MTMPTKKILLPMIIIVTLGTGFLLGFSYKSQTSPLSSVQNILGKGYTQPSDVDLNLFWQAWSVLHEKFVDKANLTNQALVYGAIEGMIHAAGDPYTVFFTPKENKSFSEQIEGAFAGIGVEIGLKNDIVTVTAPIKGTPAEKAGLKAGDMVIKIDAKSTEGMKLEDAVSLIRGKQGTPVKLTYIRPGVDGSKEITIIRDTINVPAVQWEMVDGTTAHLEVFEFSKNVDAEFSKAVKEITASKADRIILDLRDNPGGLLDSAVDLAGYFLDRGQVVTIEKFSDGTQQQYTTQGASELKRYPVVILMNGGSASASEILAGALKDNRSIQLIGQKSFGKGSVQELVDLPQNASLKVTIAKWFTPNNVSINGNGLPADVKVDITDADIKAGKDPQLTKAEAVVKSLK